MRKSLLVLLMNVRQVGKRIERQARQYCINAMQRLLNLRKDLAETVRMCWAQSEAIVRSVNLPAWLTSWLATLPGPAREAGYTTTGLLVSGGIIVFAIVLFVTKGVPQIYTLSANSTQNIEAAGAPAAAAPYWTWGMWGLIVAVVMGIAALILKQHGVNIGGGKGGGGGGSRRRRR